MRLVFLGSGEFAAPTLRWLHACPHEVALVVSQPPRGSGRGRRTTPTPAAALARELGFPTLETEEVNDPAIIARITSLGARLGVVVAFGQKLSAGLLGSLPGGCINLHASLLPKYRGAAPIQRAIVAGECQTGCTVFRIVERMDAGPTLVQRSLAIEPEETAGELHDRLAQLGVDAVGEALDMFASEIPPGRPQDDARTTYARKLAKADGVIDFQRSSEVIARHIRGMSPWPGATTTYHSADGRWERVTLLRARALPAPASVGLPPGTLDTSLHAATGDGVVEVLEIQPSSGRRMGWKDYVNGRRVVPGDRFRSASQADD